MHGDRRGREDRGARESANGGPPISPGSHRARRQYRRDTFRRDAWIGDDLPP
jgi:hypothetical protein